MEFLESQPHINSWAKDFAEGNGRAAEKLFNYFYPRIFRYFKSRIRDEAAVEDLAQEVFLKLARGIRLYNPEKGSFTPWIWQIAHNVFTDYLRAKGRRPEDAASYSETDLDAVAGEHVEIDSEFKKVTEILKTYSDDDQELFRMRYIAGLSYKEIAEITERTVNAVTVSAHRIREKLKKDLHDQSH